MVVTAGLLVVTATGVVDTGVVLTMLVVRVELLAVAHGAQPSVFTLEVLDDEELEVADPEVVEEDDLDEVVVVDEDVVEEVLDEVVVVVVVVPQDAPALTENWVESE